jgi:menaquinone-dependent protoporphyrinogen oxidase
MATSSRRNFLKVSSIVCGATILACGGSTVAATKAPKITFPANHYGDNQMAKRILIAYASKCGSTAEIADSMGKTLSGNGYSVDVLPVKMVTSLDGYDAVLAGSAIRVGAWLPEALELLKQNQAALGKLPIAIFTVHALNWENTSASEALRRNYTTAVKQLITPKDEVFFAGKIDYSKMTFLEKMMSKTVRAVEEDLRDWAAINDWAKGIPGRLGI